MKTFGSRPPTPMPLISPKCCLIRKSPSFVCLKPIMDCGQGWHTQHFHQYHSILWSGIKERFLFALQSLLSMANLGMIGKSNKSGLILFQN